MRSIPYGKQFIDRNDIREVVKVLKSDFITQGPKVAEFERNIAKYCKARYAVAVSSGTAALHIACMAAGLRKGDEAITTPITFVATANSILYAGAKPVFADVDPNTANIDPFEIGKKITAKTKAIIPVHFAGLPCSMEAIAKIAGKKDIIVIEDACHALGASYKHKTDWLKVGSCKHSDMAVLSFHPVKHITTGEGGAVVTNRKNIYDKLLMLRNHGITRQRYNFINKKMSTAGWYYEIQGLGFNYRITDFQCALGIAQLRKLDGFIRKRRAIAAEYSRRFTDNPYFDIPPLKEGARPAWHLYPIRLKNKYAGSRKRVFDALRNASIGVQVHYIPVYLHLYYKNLGYREGSCPRAEKFYESEMSIPIYPSLTEKDMTYVAKTIIRTMKDILNRR